MHDEIPPMTEKHFDIVYKRAFHDKVCFAEFDREPIASASIGQVHRAVLKDGREVAVKLRRYDIENIIRADINILNVFNRFFSSTFLGEYQELAGFRYQRILENDHQRGGFVH